LVHGRVISSDYRQKRKYVKGLMWDSEKERASKK